MIEELRWRGLLADVTEHAAQALAAGRTSGYIGFDPTAPSLHVGSLVPIMGLVHLQRAGHTPIALVGGGTGLVGDPSGKARERPLLDRTAMEENAAAIHRQLASFLDFDARSNPARTANNIDWLDRLPLVEFLRDVGKHFSVNAMLRKESVKRRLGDEETGISFTEFSYQLLQAYDFLELSRRFGCTLQMGGSDQWGNITAGIDLVRRMGGPQCHGIVFPLLTTAGGTKIGKSEAGETVWLDPNRTSPYRFYQYWLNADDADVIRFLKLFTLMSRGEVEEMAEAARQAPHRREAQKRLAADVTRTVHGPEGLKAAERASSVLFGDSPKGLSAADVEDVFADVPSARLARERLQEPGAELVVVMAETGMAPSRSEARRLLRGGGVYVNGERADDVRAALRTSDLLDDRFIVVRTGKKRYFVLDAGGERESDAP